MDFDSINCLVGILILASPFILNFFDEHRKYPIVEVKELRRYEEPDVRMDGSPAPGCREVVEYQANHWQDLRPYTEGTTIEGNRTRVVTRTGKNRYTISSEAWHTERPKKPIGMSDARYAQYLRDNGWPVRDD
jgi:hypothetical protein